MVLRSYHLFTFLVFQTTLNSYSTQNVQKVGDLRLGSLLNANTSRATIKVGLIGYPCDDGVARNQGRVGAKFGPKSFRKYLLKIGSLDNPEFSIRLDGIALKDLGDVELGATLEETHRRLTNKVAQALKEGYLPVVVGGGHDQSYPNARALMDYLGNANIGVVNIDAHLDVQHSGSSFRELLEDTKFSGNFVEFGAQGSVSSAEDAQFIFSKGGQLLWLSTLRNYHLNPVGKLAEVLDHFGSKPVFVSFDVDSIRSSDCPGVSDPGTIGFTAEEALAMCREVGRDKRVRLFDLAEFNPEIEEDRTSRLIMQMFYHFLLGVAERSSSSVSCNTFCSLLSTFFVCLLMFLNY